ncbi:MAG: M23 family metallopeptidase [Spirochaetaceae bacterium]|nr:M23 family metallopeptidase [Spirochaetaceae bacterium]
MELQGFGQEESKSSYQKIKNTIFKITKNIGKWKIFSILFAFAAFTFLIITIQYVESRQYIANGRARPYIAIERIDTHIPLVEQIRAEQIRYEKEVTVRRGETISSILNEIGTQNNHSRAIIDSLSPLFNLRRLQPGTNIKFIISQEGEHSTPLIELLTIGRSPREEIRVVYKDGSYEAKVVEVETVPRYFAKSGVIESSLYSDARSVGIPSSVIMDMFHLFSFDVDFQRDIYRGNRFKVLFRDMVNLDGKTVLRGNILFAELETARDTLKIYSFTGDDGRTDFFTGEGNSARKTLLKTPIHGARLSSGFGRRTHPIRGYTHMHRGLDFAAPRNTPILAAGSGVIEFIGWNGGYGNCIIIRHPNEFKTLYAHMNAFASGMRRGRHVRQGEVIGFVGTTGVSTGYHLHYEVIFRGQQINPSTLRTPPERRLTGSELERFLVARQEIDEKYIDVRLAWREH